MRIFIITCPKKRIQRILILFCQFLKLYDRSTPHFCASTKRSGDVDKDLEYLHYNNPVKDGQAPLSIVDKSFKHILTNQPDDFHKDLLQYEADKEPLIEAVSSR